MHGDDDNNKTCTQQKIEESKYGTETMGSTK